jgi:rare lipoprotein A
MRQTTRKIALLAALAATLAACVTTKSRPPMVSQTPLRPSIPEPTPNPIYKVGTPYQVAGIWYYPKEQPSYDETGIASWYGTEFSGRLTANGELFDRTAITGAHPTLPMPAIVRVTNLENGKSIAVRVNDRGPFANGRIIDLSERAADLLGYRVKGTARVRVTYLGRANLHGPGFAPPSQETPQEIATAVPAAPTKLISASSLPPVAGVATAAPRSISSLPKPVAQPGIAARNEITVGQVTQLPVPAATAIYVQAGAFTSSVNAGSVANRLYGLGARVMPTHKDGHEIYRVRIGPFQDVDSADAMLGRVHAMGHADVQIVVDSITG